MVLELKTVKEFSTAVGNENMGLVIIDFFTVWCGPCKRIAPKFADLADKYPNVGFYKVNAENAELQDITEACLVRSLPTFCFFYGGKYIDSIVGANEKAIENKILLYLEKEKEKEKQNSSKEESPTKEPTSEKKVDL